MGFVPEAQFTLNVSLKSFPAASLSMALLSSVFSSRCALEKFKSASKDQPSNLNLLFQPTDLMVSSRFAKMPLTSGDVPATVPPVSTLSLVTLVARYLNAGAYAALAVKGNSKTWSV